MVKLVVRNALDGLNDLVSKESGLECKDVSLAIQSQADEADINTIVRRFGLTGELPSNVRMPLQLDFVDIIDYQTARNMLLDADAAFMRMPAHVRTRFDNDPGKFVDFASDPANLAECRKLGLAVPEVSPEPGVAPAPV